MSLSQDQVLLCLNNEASYKKKKKIIQNYDHSELNTAVYQPIIHFARKINKDRHTECTLNHASQNRAFSKITFGKLNTSYY